MVELSYVIFFLFVFATVEKRIHRKEEKSKFCNV